MSKPPLVFPDDQQLIQLCKQNDRKAQNFLFEKFKKKVLFLCMRYASDEEEAKDILQEAFISIFKSLVSTKEDITSLSSWVHTIAARTSINYFRKRKKIHFTDDQKLTPIVSEEETPIEVLNAQDLLHIIQQMPDGYRLVFNLVVVEGYSHQEVSGLLSITTATSRSQLARAKEWLKKRFKIENKSYYERVFG